MEVCEKANNKYTCYFYEPDFKRDITSTFDMHNDVRILAVLSESKNILVLASGTLLREEEEEGKKEIKPCKHGSKKQASIRPHEKEVLQLGG